MNDGITAASNVVFFNQNIPSLRYQLNLGSSYVFAITIKELNRIADL